MTRKTLGALALLAVCACGAEFRLGQKQGIKPVQGDAHTTIGEFQCGQPVQADGYTVVTEQVGNDCRFTFERDVTVIAQEDYDSIDGLNGIANLVKAVELEVRSLTFTDEDTGAQLSVDTQVRDASLAINGQVVLTKAQLAQLPRVVRLEGAALDSLKTQIDARQTATVHVSAMVQVSPPYPRHLMVSYDVQPVLVVGSR